MRKITYIFTVLLFIAHFLVAQTINYPDTSILAKGTWYKVSIPSSGIYKLNYSDFIKLGVPEDKINPQNISIYGNGGHQIPLQNNRYIQSDLQEIPIFVNAPSDNLSSGYVLFYAEGTIDKTYNKTLKTYNFTIHPYSDQSYYFITFDKDIGKKKRIEKKEKSYSDYDVEVNNTRDYVLKKIEQNNILKSGRRWVGKEFSSIAKIDEYPIELQNIVSDSNVLLEYRLLSQSSVRSNFMVYLNNLAIDTSYFEPIKDQDNIAYEKIVRKEFKLSTNSNKIKFVYTGESTSKGWLDYIVLNYNKQLRYNNTSLFFRSTENFDSVKIVRHNISNASQNIIVWDVTDWLNPIQIEGTYEQENKVYSVDIKSDEIREMIAFSGANFYTPTLIGKIENQDLHSTVAVDYVIIANPLFLKQAQQLAKLHNEYSKITTKVVTTEQVYNEFSSGTPDYLAYREYLRMLYKKYKKEGKEPKNVLLFGDGTFDNKNILKRNNNFVLTYQSENSLNNTYSYVSDDFVAILSDYATGSLTDTLQIGVGRFTVNDTNEAKNMVDRSERYIKRMDVRESKNLTDWRNTIVLTADDPDDPNDDYFIKHAENIYNQVKETQPQVNALKFYEDAYKQYASTAGSTYPDASKAINQQMKKGCLLFNYVGHGSESHLASERLITIPDITGWTNYNSMPLMITSTCEFGRWDMLEKQSAGEYTISSTRGGCIGLISASRKIYSRDDINRNFFRYAIEKVDGKQLTFGQVLSHSKNVTGIGEHQRCVMFLGDPALKISLPEFNVITTKINNQDVILDELDTLRALSDVVVEGKICDDKNNFLRNFNGYVQITLYDKASNYYTLDNEQHDKKIEFEQQKNVLYRGKTKVINGEFKHEFMIPKDIAYNYGKGKFSYYAYSDSLDAGGYFSDFLIGGINENAEIIDTRPQVRLFISDSNFKSGGVTNENPLLYAIVSDKIPINVVGSGLGHDITATLDNAANTFVLNDYFVQDDNTPNKGYITFPLTDLTEGEHTLTLKVWNIYNYSGVATITFVVRKSSEEVFTNMKNYPNPFTHNTNFFLEHNQNGKINSAEIHIYNSAGKRIKTIKVPTLTDGNTIGPIEWDATMDSGAKIAPGLYFYRILLNKIDGKEYTKAEKMMYIPR